MVWMGAARLRQVTVPLCSALAGSYLPVTSCFGPPIWEKTTNWSKLREVPPGWSGVWEKSPCEEWLGKQGLDQLGEEMAVASQTATPAHLWGHRWDQEVGLFWGARGKRRRDNTHKNEKQAVQPGYWFWLEYPETSSKMNYPMTL